MAVRSSWAARKNLWEENKAKEIAHLYSVTALGWKRDGSRVAAGSLCGGVELFESVLKRAVWNNKFEITYVGPSQVLVKPLVKGARGVILKSIYGYEIEDVRIMGGENYLVARTTETLLLGDLQKNLLSEIAWPAGTGGGNEKFYFENANVCMIFNAGELSLVEYGKNEVLGSVRTEFMNPHLISVRINERKLKGTEEIKRLAYLLDLKTLALEDLVFGYALGQITHDSKIDWLELNETGRKLLFRDKRSRLNLVDIETMAKTSVLNYCTFVQWVTGSDVVVAQSRDNMAVWYNIDAPERVTLLAIKGDVVDIAREDGKTEVVVQEGQHQLTYQLDEGLIEFGTAIDDGDFNRAIDYLEGLDAGAAAETEAMWRTLARMSLESKQLHVAERCYAALGDVSKAKYLRETLNVADAAAENFGGDGMDAPEVWARLYILDRQFKAAEGIYLEQNQLDEAIQMYRRLHMWDEALNLAEAKAHPDLDSLREQHARWLLETGQEEKAGALKEADGQPAEALSLYLRGGLATRAARLVQADAQLLADPAVVGRVVAALEKGDFHEQAGEMHERVGGQDEKALASFRKAGAFARAVELARRAFPAEVVRLEEEWGNHLAQNRQLDAAINHYIEAGRTIKALDVAISARQWKKAVQIIQVVEDDSGELNKYYHKLGQHYETAKEYEMAQRFYMQANMAKQAIEMYNNAGLWEEAHQLASRYMETAEVTSMYVAQARQLEEQGRFKEAEKLYVSVQEPDLAISMYKKQRQYDQMTRLVQTFHPDLLQSTHVHLAQELEQEANHRAAEKHYLEAGDWKAAVHMYRGADHWEDAYRVAQTNGGPHSAKQVAFLWAKTLGGESAVKLLNKFGVLEQGIDYACESYQFDFAFELARLAAQHKTADIHYKHAMALEDEGKFADAETHFVRAKKPKEAVLMYVHNQDWEAAQRVAEAHDEASVADVLIGQAKVAFEARDWPKFESLLLRAQRPELAVKQYRDSDMWPEALRVCKEYLPHKLRALQDEYERESLAASSRDVDALLQQARQWEEGGEHDRAVDCYLKVDAANTGGNMQTMAAAWSKAAELAVKFLDGERALAVAEAVGPKLVEAGRHAAAAQLYLAVEMVKEAVDAFVAAHEWSKARKVARELEPRLEPYVEQKYKDHLQTQGQFDELVNVDLERALDILVEQGNWAKAIETAAEHGPELQHKYVAHHATQLIRDGQPLEALQLYKRHGAPAQQQNFNIYKRIAVDLFAAPSANDAEGRMYYTWAALRDVLFELSENMSGQGELDGTATHKDFKLLLLIAHYLAVRSACQTQASLAETAAKLSVSLLRHSDVLPADKAFFEAGSAAKGVGWDNMAFVFFNRYLDLYEAIEERTLDMLDNSDFAETDVPFEVPLPERPHLATREHEAVKEWVLAVSMDQKVEQQLPMDGRMTYEASLVAARTGTVSPACIVTGYPVTTQGKIDFARGMVAIKEEWNKFVMVAKMVTDNEVQDVIKFIGTWGGLGGGAPGFSFQ